MNELAQPDASPAPARPESLTVDYYRESDTVVVHKKRGGGPRAFLLLWLIGWTVGCVVLLGECINDPALGTFAFALPFWAAWVLVAAFLVWMTFGKETLLLRADEALFLRTAIVQLSSRAVPREEIQGFRECRSSHTENDEHLWGIELVTLGRPLRFCYRLPDRERAWLIHQLNGFLFATEPPAGDGRLRTEAIAREVAADDDDTSVRERHTWEVLAYARTLASPPSDSAWRDVEQSQAFEISSRGRWHIGALALLLFFNAFWNGIVSVFVMQLFGLMPADEAPVGWEWWGLFVFLIPFEAIGLAMFAALALVALEPFRRTIWRFEQDRIVRITRWPVYGRTRVWDVAVLDRLELRRHRGSDARPKRFSDMTADPTAQASFELAFISSENVDLCAVGNLTEGEARWMARIVLERRPKWFGS